MDELIADLKRDEGWRPSVYKDHLGFFTLGYGFLVDDRKGGELPRRIGELWLRHAVKERWNGLLTAEPWIQEQPEDVQRALGNMVYQMGVGGVLRFRRMLEALKSGHRVTAAAEALNSRWAEQTPERAARVADLIRGVK